MVGPGSGGAGTGTGAGGHPADAGGAGGQPADAATGGRGVGGVAGLTGELPGSGGRGIGGAAAQDAAAELSDAATDNGAGPEPPSAAGPTVLMRGNDLQRTGANLAEATLRPSAITPGGFGKLFCKGIDDDVYGQILYMSGVDFGALGRRNVIYVVTMNDSVYALDADDPTPAPLWHTNYTDPAGDIIAVPTTDLARTSCGVYLDIAHQVGITSTPVIDPATMTMYLVARTREAATSYIQRLHAISLTDGSERPGSPVVLEAAAPGTGDGSLGGLVHLDPMKNNQRAGLLLHDGVVYIAFSSHCDEGPYHGWLLGYDARTVTQVVAYTSTPNGGMGGIWMYSMILMQVSRGIIPTSIRV